MMNRRIFAMGLVVALCMFLYTAAALAEAPKPKDVPPDHPAYRAIQSLIERGYVGLLQDGSFQGDHPVDRYTLATVIAKLMADIQSGKIVLPNEEMKTLRQLATEFRAELVEVAGQTSQLAQAQEKTAGEVAVVREDTTRLLGDMYQQQQTVNGLDQRVQTLQGQLQEQKAENARQADAIKALQDQLVQEQAAKNEALQAVTKTVNEVLVPQSEALIAKQQALETMVGDLRSEYQSYRKASDAELASLKNQTRNQLVGGLIVAALLFMAK